MNKTSPKSIYIIGAQCTGKTTLVNALQASFDHSSSPPAIIKEVARTVLSTHDFTADDITTNPPRCSTLQTLIMKAQHSTEQEALKQSPWFISDRSGLDPLVYAARHVSTAFANTMMLTPEWQSLRCSLARSLIFVCEPTTDWLVDDGTRLMPATAQDWEDYHRAFCSWLEALGLEYRVLPCTMRDLDRRVQYIWGIWRGSLPRDIG